MKRPVSCNVSSESLSGLSLPRIVEEKYYQCPGGNLCQETVRESLLIQHINKIHNMPLISFGTSSAEITLPPKKPVENASLILLEDKMSFWLRLIVQK